MDVVFVGGKKAPFLRSVLEEYGYKSLETPGWNIDGLNIDEHAGFEEKACTATISFFATLTSTCIGADGWSNLFVAVA